MSASQARRELGTARHFELPDQDHETDVAELPWTTSIRLLRKGVCLLAGTFLVSRSFCDLNSDRHENIEQRYHDVTRPLFQPESFI